MLQRIAHANDRWMRVLAYILCEEALAEKNRNKKANDRQERHQLCCAHLRRDFQAMVDRHNAGSGDWPGVIDAIEAVAGVMAAGAGRDGKHCQPVPAGRTGVRSP
jgi:hypothetical protein